ncbi:DNA-binding response regulator [Chitiniphilus shinanonensis]|uniref:DNA-binding response regulator n=1 Tax=Chitiniphilus shinanonensis TaxID=553088 RepID=A0ABQ6BWW7_9NEIS|nr:response regulator transcription factor [Chitiniphilus shinanonensis]GLS05821.1 DNA-binding response regulator [Chitiniphilus shinanonensis]
MQNKIQVILADDHPVVRMGLSQMLANRLDMAVVGEAGGVGDLLRMVAVLPFDVVITDFYMPDPTLTDGLSLIRRLRRTMTEDQHIVVLTMLDNLAFVDQMLEAGATSVLNKHDPLDEVIEAILHAARGDSYLSSGIRSARLAEGNRNAPSQWAALSPRESEVIRLYLTGMSVTSIAHQVHRSVKTISQQKKSAMDKLGAPNDVALFQIAKEGGMIG